MKSQPDHRKGKLFFFTLKVHSLAAILLLIPFSPANVASAGPVIAGSSSAAGYALYFDGGDHVRIGTDRRLNPASQYTIEAWVKLEVLPGWRVIFSRYNYSVVGAYWLGRKSTYSCSSEMPFRGVDALDRPEAMVWTHLAVVYDQGTVRLYRDGVPQQTKTGAGCNSISVATLIGADHSHGEVATQWKGWIDEVRFWGVARTDTQIESFMFTPLTGEETGLIGYWNFDEGEGQIAGDSSPNRLNGTLGAGSEPGDDDPQWVVSDAPLKSSLSPTVTPILVLTATPMPTVTPTPRRFAVVLPPGLSRR